jgi:hypothetical protein
MHIPFDLYHIIYIFQGSYELLLGNRPTSFPIRKKAYCIINNDIIDHRNQCLHDQNGSLTYLP